MKTLKGICFASCLALLLALPVASYASEKTYQVTETELGKLEDNLNQLQKVNEEQKKNSETLKKEQIEEGRNGVSEAQRTADRLEENSDRAGSLIGESQSILSGIRERGEEGKGET